MSSSLFSLEEREDTHKEKTKTNEKEAVGEGKGGGEASSKRGRDGKKVSVSGRAGAWWGDKKSEKREKRALKAERIGKGAPEQNGKDVSLETVRAERREEAKRTHKESMPGRRREVEGPGALKEDGNGNESGDGEQGLDHRAEKREMEKPEPLGSEREYGSEVRYE